MNDEVLWAVLDARDASIDALRRRSAALEVLLSEKENTIRQLIAARHLADVSIEQMDQTIQRLQSQSILHKIDRLAGHVVNSTMRALMWRAILSPRLGNLNQYAPRLLLPPKPLSLPVSVDDLPTISIVTPSFEQGSYIEKTIRSVLDQKYPKLEYFVQDGGSTDETVEILRRHEGELSGWKSERDNGQSQAINAGFRRTRGEIMAWLNSDDLLLPGALACVADYFSRHPEIDVVYGNRLLIDDNGMEIGRWIMPGHDGEVLTWADYVPQETLFWRRRIWEKVGGRIDESFCFAMDWDLLVRFRDAGARFAHIPRFLGAFRVHERQKTSAAIGEIGYGEMDRIRERVLRRIPSRREIRMAVLPFMMRHVVVDIAYRITTRLGGRWVTNRFEQ